jgi:hypothetical protein
VEKVSVNRGLLIGVVAVAGASVLGLAFVLGRESGSGVSAPPTRIERVAPRPQEEPPALPTPVAASAAMITERPETRPISAPAPSAPAPWVPVQAPPVQVPAPVDGERRGAGPDPERASVVAYFDAVDHIQPGAMSGEADGIANEMAAALANGDTSGLDKMIRQTEAAKERLAAIAPPAPCATFHRESLGSLDDGLEVLRSLKTAMESPEPATQLAGVAARANTLRSRADVLQKEEQALRQRYGLKQ